MSSNGVTRISGYDGSNIWLNPGQCLFEIGPFLGQGVAGTVHECSHCVSHMQYAIKILHPLGYKINSSIALKKFNVLLRGKQYDDISKLNRAPIAKEDVWWLLNSSTKTYVSAYWSAKESCLKELSLNQCMDIWGVDPVEADAIIASADQSSNIEAVSIPLTGQRVYVPKLPPKYLEFVRQRKRIFREINNMRKMSSHPNIIKLEGVLELVQESKDVIFLVMELANGGELFDKIKLDNGAREKTAKYFFRQLVLGIKHCHDQGVCHRDLKPENLLLQDTTGGSDMTNGGDVEGFILKIADFGLSSRFLMQADGNQMDSGADSPGTPPSTMVPLRSIVGSPHYVAPEVLQERGYDGTKADVWSLGVVLYAMLAGSLPFDSNMQTCPRYAQFCKWISANSTYDGMALWNYTTIEYPNWFFGPQFSPAAKGLIISMLNPNPSKRITINEVLKHPLATGATTINPYSVGEESKSSSTSPQVSVNILPEGYVSDCLNDRVDNNQMGPSSNSSVQHSASSRSAISSLASEDSGSNGEELRGDNLNRNTVKFTLDIDSIRLEDGDMRESPAKKMVESRDRDSDLMFEMEEDCISNSDSSMDANKTNSRSSSGNSNSDSQRNVQGAMSAALGLEKSKAHDSNVSSGFSNGDRDDHAEYMSLYSSLTPQLSRTSSRDSIGGIHMSGGNKPPLAPAAFTATPSIDDLITSDDESHGSSDSNSVDKSPRSPINQPPSFVDSVKRSTRFITAVPAADVLIKMECILETCRVERVLIPGVGYIGKVVLNWQVFSLEVYDCNGGIMGSIHIYQLPSSYSINYSSSPSKSNGLFGMVSASPSKPPLFGSPVFRGDSFMNSFNPQPDYFLVEFVRCQMEIFTFKRFYQWIRHELSALVKRDYAITLFDQYGASPKITKEIHRLS